MYFFRTIILFEDQNKSVISFRMISFITQPSMLQSQMGGLEGVGGWFVVLLSSSIYF